MGKLSERTIALKRIFKRLVKAFDVYSKQVNIPLLCTHLAMGFGLVVISESMYRRSIIKTLSWIVFHPLFMLMNLAIVIAVIAIGHLIVKRAYKVSALAVVAGLVLSAINAGKYALRSVPLTPDDALLIKEVWALKGEIINKQIILYMIVGVLLIGVVVYGIYKAYDHIRTDRRGLTNGCLLVVSILLLAMGQSFFSSNISLEKTGFFYSLSNMTRRGNNIPEDIQIQARTQVHDDIMAYGQKTSENPVASDVKPNVIVIMSEAFWDINKMGIEFTENPVPYFEKLREESIYGELYVPVVGGGTVNTEFEVMTGMTLKNYCNDWYMVYPNEIKTPYPSLASIFRNQGYESIGLHPYMSWYYNRYEVYKHFGFDTFKSLEFMGDTEKFGGFTKDQVTFDEILSLIKTTDKPLFNYTVTIQNHGPFGDVRFANDERTLSLKTPMSDSATYLINNYIQGLYYSDKAFENFIETLRTLDEPTIVVFFGDHLPMLGEDFLAYRECGYIGNEEASEVYENLDMMTVPYLVWRNDQQLCLKTPTMNASFLTPKILEWANVAVPDYLKAVAMMSERTPIMTHRYVIDAENQKNDFENYAYLLSRAEYEQIKKHLLDSDGLFDTDKWLITDNVDYNAALQSMTISETETSSEGTAIKGGAFVPEVTVLVNDTPVTCDYVDSKEIVIEEALDSKDTVQVIVSGPQGKLLTSSNIYKIP